MTRSITLTVVLMIGLLAAAPAARADEEKTPGTTLCTMTFDLKGWSVFYATGKGQGVITCDNGQTAKVKLKVTGGGLTAGKSTVRNATGRFTEVSDISELYGGWAAAGASAAAGKAAATGVVTKGDISLTLVGTGTGVQLGFGGAKLSIQPDEAAKDEPKSETDE
jgi:hypothetical protein